MIKLTDRLQLVANLVENCDSFLDIGTDHAYLPAFLVEQGKAKKAIASDINPNPLENARQTLLQENLEDKISLRLSAGFENISENEATEIAVAGMGGLMIAEMIENTPWLQNPKYHLVLQPMTHFEDVRRALQENGFEIIKEATVKEGKRLYLVISAKYSGKTEAKTDSWYYVGSLLESENETDREFVQKILSGLYNKYNGTHDDETLKLIRSIENG